MVVKLFDGSLVGTAQEAVDFITNILQASTEYSVIGKGLDGTILLWNEGARRIYGYEPGVEAVPFLLITATGKGEGNQAEAMRAGASTFLARPLVPQALLAEVLRHLAAGGGRTPCPAS